VSDTWAHMVRQSCDQCGSTAILWGTALELPWRIPEGEGRRRAVELLQLLGGDSDAWTCLDCHQFGVFGPTELYVPSRAARRAAARDARRH
jgi:hypothetical protein